jgi:hypothetical protein
MDNYIVEQYLEYIQEISATVPWTGAAGAAAVGTGAMFAPVLAAVSIFSAFNMAFQLYKNYFTKAARQCKDLPGKEKAVCMLRAKSLGKEAELKALKQASAKCMKTKSPEKCKAKFNQKMSKVGGEAGFLKSRMQQLSQQKYAE